MTQLPWNIIRETKLSEGFSEEFAREFATKEMQKRREAFNPYSVVGKQEEEAKTLLIENGYSMRVQSRDVGQPDFYYLDWRPSRCNVRINKGLVSEIVDMC